MIRSKILAVANQIVTMNREIALNNKEKEQVHD